jgi:hypothetical protein
VGANKSLVQQNLSTNYPNRLLSAVWSRFLWDWDAGVFPEDPAWDWDLHGFEAGRSQLDGLRDTGVYGAGISSSKSEFWTGLHRENGHQFFHLSNDNGNYVHGRVFRRWDAG